MESLSLNIWRLHKPSSKPRYSFNCLPPRLFRTQVRKSETLLWINSVPSQGCGNNYFAVRCAACQDAHLFLWLLISLHKLTIVAPSERNSTYRRMFETSFLHGVCHRGIELQTGRRHSNCSRYLVWMFLGAVILHSNEDNTLHCVGLGLLVGFFSVQKS